MEYLKPDSPEAFIDWPAKEEIPEDYKECGKCKGHGGWNLRINAYLKSAQQEKEIREGLEKTHYANLPLMRHDMSPELFRHYYAHFRASCDNCNGWGFIPESETCPIHKWEFHRSVAMCLTEYKCAHCGRIQSVDSSD